MDGAVLIGERRRKVALLINDMNAAGGIQRVAANLVRDLRPWYDTVLLSVEPLPRRAIFHEPGLDFRTLGRTRRFWRPGGRMLHLASAALPLRRWVEREAVDTVLAIWYDWAAVAAVALPRRVKRVGCEHISFDEAPPRMARLRALTYRYLDCAVALTDHDRPLLQRISKQVHTIPNYVRTLDPRPYAGREKILLTVGHLDSRKGIDRLLWGLKPALLAHPEWKLVVVGGGEKGHTDWGYMDYLSVLIHVLELGGRVEFHPATDRIEEWYRRASVYVMGSRREGLPMVLIEAKGHGLPVVAFDCPTGPREIIRDGVDGFLVDNDSEAFAGAAMSLMANEELRTRMSAAAREDAARRFSAEQVLEQWRALIEGLHGKAPVPALAPVPA